MRVDAAQHYDLTPELDRNAPLEQVAQQFEAILLAEVLKNLSESVSGTTSEGAFGGALDGVMWQEMFRQITESRQIGLADAVYRQLSDNADATVDASSVGPPPQSRPLRESATPLPLDRESAGPTHPVNGVVSSRYGMRRDPLDASARFHHGLDVAAPEGTAVRAPASGRVVFAGTRGGYGQAVVVEHPDGFQTLFAHLSQIDVAVGATIDQGAVLGRVGQSGRATGPHLHFEVRKEGERIDPETWLPSKTV